MFEPSKETLELQSLLEKAPDHAYLTYDDISKASGIAMDTRGKQLLRTAVKRCDRAYRVDRGVGIELDGPKNTMNIVSSRLTRISSAIKKGHNTTQLMMARNMERMDQPHRDRLTASASLLGAIMAVSTGLKRLYSSKPEQLTVSKIPLPWDKPTD